jgi:hypothetical protein
VITGIAAAAEYLGYGKPDRFRRARARNPIPRRNPHPRWPTRRAPHALRDSHSKLKITSNRAHRSGPG